jgi:hypothetical protein
VIVEERIYTLHPGQAGAYLKAYESEGMAIQKPILGRMVGYYQTEFGTLNQVIHLWAYEDLAERTEKRARLQADARWQAYVAKVRPLILRQENKLLLPAPFLKVKWQD